MRRAVAVLFVALALVGAAPGVAAATTPGTPMVHPVKGRWFTVDGRPGQQVVLDAVIENPSDVPTDVRLGLADLRFDAKDQPQLVEPATDVGTWGRFDVPSVTVPAHGTRTVSLTLRVPDGTDPGDHIGAVVAETTAAGAGGIGVVKRVATRLYVTVPGAVRAGVAITSVHVDRGHSLSPRSANVVVIVRNTGDVRVAPTVTVAGHRANGASLLLSHAAQSYVLRRSLPAWGGPQSWPIEVDTRVADGAGPSASATASTFVFPWLPLALLVLVVLLALAAWRASRRRRGRLDALAAHVAQLEAALLEQAGRGDAPRPERKPVRERPLRAAAEVDQGAGAPGQRHRRRRVLRVEHPHLEDPADPVDGGDLGAMELEGAAARRPRARPLRAHDLER